MSIGISVQELGDAGFLSFMFRASSPIFKDDVSGDEWDFVHDAKRETDYRTIFAHLFRSLVICDFETMVVLLAAVSGFCR